MFSFRAGCWFFYHCFWLAWGDKWPCQGCKARIRLASQFQERNELSSYCSKRTGLGFHIGAQTKHLGKTISFPDRTRWSSFSRHPSLYWLGINWQWVSSPYRMTVLGTCLYQNSRMIYERLSGMILAFDCQKICCTCFSPSHWRSHGIFPC